MNKNFEELRPNDVVYAIYEPHQYVSTVTTYAVTEIDNLDKEKVKVTLMCDEGKHIIRPYIGTKTYRVDDMIYISSYMVFKSLAEMSMNEMQKSIEEFKKYLKDA